MNIGFAQINSTIGDFSHNAEKILTAYDTLVTEGADLVITPELALTGYPPQDLLLAGEFVGKNLTILAELQQRIGDVPLLVGFIDSNKGQGKPFHNAAALITKGTEPLIAHKRLLPSYDVFDEARYFEPGTAAPTFFLKNHKIGITICEDLWTPKYLPGPFYSTDPLEELATAGATLLVNLSASPFQLGKPSRRIAMIQEQARRFHLPICYCNAVGGNDQLVFDGHSLVVAADGTLVHEMKGFCEENSVVSLQKPSITAPETNCKPSPQLSVTPAAPDEIKELYQALILGLHDYFKKCKFQSALLGLSGGIDSAVVAVLAAEALGASAVTGVTMPGPYSSAGSVKDAQTLARNLFIACKEIPITPLYQTMITTLMPLFSGHATDTTEENLQARLRGIVLMALSNKFGSLLLTTGNKSELAVGYCTLYGDMCGGLAVISDLPKTVVYKLAHWINRDKEIIPWNTIHKAPSAELRPNQKDQDSLPPYEILDAILQLFIEENLSAREIVARGFDAPTVKSIIALVNRNEYKRQQAAPGLKMTSKAFGIGRRLPIAQQLT